ncbi:Aspartic proteinase nepenthesin-2 [Dichanthelium oligosanthes]|uniref:Aspartic proteinase nepenthesin-2 n=1 Tax=Dichanthelium oligosanthes TaxID=888268 RepID=A0A1E5VHY5_9POAL|nr:Aspartic proteinase nepenthesin-2 [Dichanthelium oligosanthes]
MASSAFVLLLVPILASLAATGNASFDLRAELNHPYAGSPLSNYEMVREATSTSKARRAWNAARLAKACGRGGGGGGGAISLPDVPVTSLGKSIYTLTVGIGTPPQQHKLVHDTGSDLVWIQCKLLNGTATPTDPLYDPDKSSSFAAIPCVGRLCREGEFEAKDCSSSNKCVYTYAYGSGRTVGVLASEIFTFGVQHKVAASLGFGCGTFLNGDIFNASGFLGLSPDKLSFVSQLKIPRFSYCLTPYTDRKSGRMFFGAMADLSKYRTTGPIQTTSFLNDRIGSNLYYYLPLIGVSVGTKRLNVPLSSFGSTFVDSGYTTGALPATARDALKKALVDSLKLPRRNSSDPDYDFCFQLPHGVPMTAVQAPPLVYHFDGGAAMVLARDNYLVEVSPGEMCLVIGEDQQAVIGNYQQQNMHVLFDVQNQKFSFAPTQCDQI